MHYYIVHVRVIREESAVTFHCEALRYMCGDYAVLKNVVLGLLLLCTTFQFLYYYLYEQVV